MEVWLGFAGGMASELLDWFRIRKELHLGVPGWAKSWLYWAITVAMAGVGGLLVFMYRTSGIEGAHSRFPGHALTPTGVMAIRCKQFHLPDL